MQTDEAIFEAIFKELEARLGAVHARQRLGIERDHEAIFGHGINFFHPENWYSTHAMIRMGLKLTGLYWRGHRNTTLIQIRHNSVELAGLPAEFDGFKLLHLTDFHADLSVAAMGRLKEILPGLAYDVCVLTGDFRGQTFGPFEASLHEVAGMMAELRQPVYGVLGNHDTIRMVPALERMGIRMLLNESATIERGGQRIHLVGIDDAHYYRADNMQKAAAGISPGEIALLLSHTPEVYRQAADAGFQMMLSGHTHGGQICLPGSIPITLDSVLPRSMGAGAWNFSGMAGYTSTGVGSSIVAVRLNCLPEITLHHLRCARPIAAAQ